MDHATLKYLNNRVKPSGQRRIDIIKRFEDELKIEHEYLRFRTVQEIKNYEEYMESLLDEG